MIVKKRKNARGSSTNIQFLLGVGERTTTEENRSPSSTSSDDRSPSILLL